MKLYKALEDRIQCLQKICDSSNLFLGQLETSDLSQIKSFEIWRSSAFKKLTFLDAYILKFAKNLPEHLKNEKYKHTVRNFLEIADNLIYYIRDIDMKICDKIQHQKSGLLRDLALADQAKKNVNKFRSEVAPKAGGQLDGKI